MNFRNIAVKMEYHCLGCNARYDVNELHYTCPECGSVFILEDLNFDELKKTSGKEWREIFDARCATKNDSLRGIFRFYELFAPVMEEDEILYLGEGNTPIVASSPALNEVTGIKTSYKNDGQNPSASFKDRGMACAFSYINALMNKNDWDEILTVCASTGDTSAAAALYASYMKEGVKSVVILPQASYTAAAAQPLGAALKFWKFPAFF